MKEVRDYLITDLPSYASNPGFFLEFHNERVDVCTNDRVYKTLIANFGLLVTALTLSTVHDSSNSHCFSRSWSTRRNSTSN